MENFSPKDDSGSKLIHPRPKTDKGGAGNIRPAPAAPKEDSGSKLMLEPVSTQDDKGISSSSRRITPNKTHKSISRRLKQHSERLAADDGMVPYSAPTGLSISQKFSLAITIVSAVITLVSGVVIAYQTKSNMTDEILKQGISSVKLAANLGKALVRQTYLDMAEKLNSDDYKDKREAAAYDFVEKLKIPLGGLDLEKLLKNDMARSSGGSLDSTFLDANITFFATSFGKKAETEMFSFAKSKGDEKHFSIETNKEIVLSGNTEGITIMEGRLTKGAAIRKIYEFSMELDFGLPKSTDASVFRPENGKARVFLDANMIENSQDAIFKMTAIILVISIVVSIIVAISLAKSITRPINRLVEDMSIVSKGDLDHKTMPRSTDEVGYLAVTFDRLTRELKEAQVIEIEQTKLKHELQVGHDIQQILLPKSCQRIPGYDPGAFYLAANELGGDYYDFIVVDKTHLGIVVADVSGKGIPASIYMTIMRTVLNIAAVGNLSCQNCLLRTNKFLSDRIKRGMFVTALYAILDCKNHVLKFSSAGHNPMFLYKGRTKEIERLNLPGLALGFDKGPLFERMLKEREVHLEKGDRFIMYTDGVVESMDVDRKEYTEKNLCLFLKEHAEEDSATFIKKLVKELQEHQGKAPQHDDITIVSFRKL